MMKNYFNADMHRIRRNHGHVVWLLVILIALAAIAAFRAGDEEKYMDFIATASGGMPIYLGIIIFFAVFADDTKAGTMQVAIGRGLTRAQVVWAKVMEGVYLTVIYYALAGVILAVIPMVMHLQMASADYLTIVTSILGSVFNTMLYFNIGMIFIVATLKSNYAEIIFILFVFDIIPGAINLLLGLCYTNLGWPNLLPYLYSSMVGSFLDNPMANLGNALGMIIYLAVSLFLTIRIFKKKELEF